MRLRIIGRGKRVADEAAAAVTTSHLTPAAAAQGQATPAQPIAATNKASQSPANNPRSLGNPYGRLFTQDKSFADLVAQKQGEKTD